MFRDGVGHGVGWSWLCCMVELAMLRDRAGHVEG